MTLRLLGQQLVRDLKASWQKSAVLAVLLCVGMVFWIPPLVRALGGGSEEKSGATAGRAAGTQRTAERHKGTKAQRHREVPAGGSPGSSSEPDLRDRNLGLRAHSWKKAQQLLRSDPLVRSVEVAAIQSDPFRLDHDQFPPPILFAEDPPQPDPEQTAGTDDDGHRPKDGPQVPEGLVLKSTILGVRRRAAYINSKLYFEGTEVRAGGEAYRLAAVHPRKVVLTRGEETFELKIAAPTASANIEIDQEHVEEPNGQQVKESKGRRVAD